MTPHDTPTYWVRLSTRLVGSGFKSQGARENPVSSQVSWVFFNIGRVMKRIFALLLCLALTIGMGTTPAISAACSESDTESIRALLVPITRLSAHQGRNSAENKEVLKEIQKISQSSKSLKLKKSLKKLEDVIRDGERNPGSTEFWGYREGSAWKTYKQALTLTQKSRC